MANAWKGIVGQGFSKEDFAQYVNTVEFDVWRPQFVVLHNTAVPTFADWHKISGQQRMLNLQHYYRDIQQWSGGPHLFVADDLIWAFTPLNVPGVHSPSWNAISWGVEMIGDYEAEPLGDAVKENAVSALATLHSLIGLDSNDLKLHHEDPKTTHKCPGKNVIKSDFQNWILARMQETDPGEHVLSAVRG